MPIISQEQFTALPPNERKYYAEMMAQADAIRQQPNVTYPDQRIADFPQELKTAQEATNEGFGTERDMLDMAANGIGKGVQPFHENYQAYMNPYQQNVIRQISEEGNRNFTEHVLPALEARFLRLGQHGSSKHADLSMRAARDFQRELLGKQQQALASGYQQAGQM